VWFGILVSLRGKTLARRKTRQTKTRVVQLLLKAFVAHLILQFWNIIGRGEKRGGYGQIWTLGLEDVSCTLYSWVTKQLRLEFTSACAFVYLGSLEFDSIAVVSLHWKLIPPRQPRPKTIPCYVVRTGNYSDSHLVHRRERVHVFRIDGANAILTSKCKKNVFSVIS